MAQALRLTLLGRPECGLCEDMARYLLRLRIPFEELNIDSDPRLQATYGEAIPVLLLGDREIARAPQSQRTLKRALARAGLLSAVR